MTETAAKPELTFIDREEDAFTVVESTIDGEPVLGLKVTNPDGTDLTIEFFKDDAPFIEWLIREAAK